MLLMLLMTFCKAVHYEIMLHAYSTTAAQRVKSGELSPVLAVERLSLQPALTDCPCLSTAYWREMLSNLCEDCDLKIHFFRLMTL